MAVNRHKQRRGIKANARQVLGISQSEYNQFRNLGRTLQIRRERELRQLGWQNLSELEKLSRTPIITPFVSTRLSGFENRAQFESYKNWLLSIKDQSGYLEYRTNAFREGYIKAIEKSAGSDEAKRAAINRLNEMSSDEFRKYFATERTPRFYYFYKESDNTAVNYELQKIAGA